MGEGRWSRTQRRVFRGPFGDVEVRWWRRRPRVYRSAELVAAPERPAAVAVLAAPKETTWIEIHLVDETGEPIPGEKYEITLPDGTVQAGSLNFRGRARIDDIEQPGSCAVRFPDLDADAWEKI